MREASLIRAFANRAGPGWKLCMSERVDAHHDNRYQKAARFSILVADEAKGQVAALTTSALMIFDATEGKLMKTVGGLSNPHCLLQARSN
jgi:hypothetical protein